MALPTTNPSLHAEQTGAATSIHDMFGGLITFGRGTAENGEAITYVGLRNESGTYTYAYINAATNGWIITTTRP